MERIRHAGIILLVALAMLLNGPGAPLQNTLVERVAGTPLAQPTANAYAGWGVIRVALGDPKGATADYSRALRLKNDSGVLRYLRGLAYAECGNHPAAIADFNVVARRRPGFVAAYRERGDARAHRGLSGRHRRLHARALLRADPPDALLR